MTPTDAGGRGWSGGPPLPRFPRSPAPSDRSGHARPQMGLAGWFCKVCGARMRLFLGPRPRYICIRAADHPSRRPDRRYTQPSKRKAG